MHSGFRDRSRSVGRSVQESAERLTRWRQARRGGKADRRRGKSIILTLLETLIQILDATQELNFTHIGSRRRDYVQGVIESIRSSQWLPKKNEPILEGWEVSDLDSDLGESLYNESEADEEFVPSNEPLRPSSRYPDIRPEPVVLSANPYIAPSSASHFSEAAASGDSDVEVTEEVVDIELPPLPPPPQSQLVNWHYLKRAQVTLADQSGVIWSPDSDPDRPPFQGKFLPTARKPGQRFGVFFLSCSQCYGMDCYTTRGVVGWGVMTSLNLHTWSLLR